MYAIRSYYAGSAFDLGLVGFVQFVPLFALMLVAGHFADRYDRRKVVAVANVCEGGAAAVLAIGTFGGWLTPGLIFAIIPVMFSVHTIVSWDFRNNFV